MEDLKGYIILEAPDVVDKPRVISDNNSKDDVVIETILQEAEVPNRNKRIYSKKAIESGIAHQTFQEKLSRKSLFGEANHPMSDSIERQTSIDQTRMSHIVKEVWWEGNLLKGIVASANTACGKDFAGLVRQGCEMAFSMRGLGGVVKKEGELTRVSDPLLIVTYDWVIYPSHSNAYQTKILKENAIIDSLMPKVNTKANNKMLHEGMLIPTNFKEAMTQYILDESKELRNTLLELEVEPTNCLLDEQKMMMTVQSDKGTMKLFMEDNIKREINNFMLRL